MSTAAIQRCSDLERKLAHLNVATEDKSESIDLLLQAIQDTDQNAKSEYEHQHAELRLEYQQASDRYDQELKIIRQTCSDSIEVKKALASELAEMVEWKKEEEEKLSRAFQQIRQRLEENIQAKKKQWLDGRKKREQEWMAKKVTQVRKATLEALEPELKRLLATQKTELDELETEKETKFKYIQLEAKRNYDNKISDHKSEVISRTRVSVARRRETWMDQISSLQQSFTDQLKSNTDENYEQKNEAVVRREHAEARHILEESHTRDMDRITDTRDKRIKELETLFQTRKDGRKIQHEDAVEIIRDQDARKKEAWTKQYEATMQKEHAQKALNLYHQIQTERDAKIDHEIRVHQKKETKFEQEFAANTTEERNNIESKHTKEFEILEQEIASKRSYLKESSSVINELQDSVQAYQDQIDMTERRIAMIQTRISHMSIGTSLDGDIDHGGCDNVDVDIGSNSYDINGDGSNSHPSVSSKPDQVFGIHAEKTLYQRKLKIAKAELDNTKNAIDNFQR